MFVFRERLYAHPVVLIRYGLLASPKSSAPRRLIKYLVGTNGHSFKEVNLIISDVSV